MMKTDTDDLKTALKEYFKAVESQQTETPEDLMPIVVKLDEVSEQIAPSADPQLRHFLQNKSYRKAYQFLNENPHSVERGSCSPK